MNTVLQLKQKKLVKKYSDLLKQEAVIGGLIFGPLPQGHRREFVCLDERTWIWHEEWVNQTGDKRAQTTRYDVTPRGVIKYVNDGSAKFVSPSEGEHLLLASRLYLQRISLNIYQSANAI
ncbi:MAG: hypothetical protein MUF85_01045 [Patescibacteria group bacterium]|jgi:hypothetical protein|nr:hypothetical protein [Patescibacteria group bacterium]